MLDTVTPPRSPIPPPEDASWLFRVGKWFDVLMCVIFFPASNRTAPETVSHYAARSCRDGHKRWACTLCRILSIVVERDHCARTLADQSLSRVVFWRAAAAFLIPLILLHWLAVLAIHSF